MEQFVVSARKYRPTTFKDVVGQQAITNTLENAIANNHLAQALLFTGPRGVGKTTCARILAKRINQDGSTSEDEDFAFNIFELDAASNNSVDDIRSLIEQVRIPPQVGKYKVYIIDEVHMLSAQAFNAFLKTLEEPPKHAIFILATTEKHKIIPTILSRCQIFDFKRITVRDIKEHLAEVAKAEGIEADDDALQIIAQKADGALRDSLSIFDRVVSFSGKNLSREAVTENLNVLDYTWYFAITDLLLDNNIPQVLLMYNEILSKGFDGQHFVMGLASHFRDLMVSKNEVTIQLLDVGDQIKTEYLRQSQKATPQFLLQATELANSCDLKYKASQNQRLLVELCLMQIATLTYEDEKKNLSSQRNGISKILSPALFRAEKPLKPKTQTKTETTSVYSNNENPISVAKEPEAPKQPTPETSDSVVQLPTLEEEQLKNIKSPNDYFKARNLTGSSANRGVSAFSKRSIQIKQELQPDDPTHGSSRELPTNQFSKEEFLNVWNAFALEIEQQGRFNLHSHLTMQEPGLEGAKVLLEFPNHTIKTELEQEKQELLHYLREKLQNYDIDLEITVREVLEQKYAYSPREKYEKLKELNPLIERLRKELDLDL